jgi:hypothetical protein
MDSKLTPKMLFAALAGMAAAAARAMPPMKRVGQYHKGDSVDYYTPPTSSNKFTPHQGAREIERRRARGW